MESADAAGDAAEREHLLHEVRKEAKRTRYAAEAASPVLGKRAKRLAARAESVQEVLGEHQDSVVAREELRRLGAASHGTGVNGFTFGLLHGREQLRGDAAEARLGDVWARAFRPKAVRWLG
jgi:CHAD domain-containing protein